MGKYIISLSQNGTNAESVVDSVCQNLFKTDTKNKPTISWTNPKREASIPNFKFFPMHFTLFYTDNTTEQDQSFEGEIKNYLNIVQELLSELVHHSANIISLEATDLEVTENGWVILRGAPTIIQGARDANLDVLQCLHNVNNTSAEKHGIKLDRFANPTDYNFHVSIGKIDFNDARNNKQNEIDEIKKKLALTKDTILAEINKGLRNVSFDMISFDYNSDGTPIGVRNIEKYEVKVKPVNQTPMFSNATQSTTDSSPSTPQIEKIITTLPLSEAKKTKLNEMLSKNFDQIQFQSYDEKKDMVEIAFELLAISTERGHDAQLLALFKLAASNHNGTINLISHFSSNAAQHDEQHTSKFIERLENLNNKEEVANALFYSAKYAAFNISNLQIDENSKGKVNAIADKLVTWVNNNQTIKPIDNNPPNPKF